MRLAPWSRVRRAAVAAMVAAVAGYGGAAVAYGGGRRDGDVGGGRREVAAMGVATMGDSAAPTVRVRAAVAAMVEAGRSGGGYGDSY